MKSLSNERILELVDIMRYTDSAFEKFTCWEDFTGARAQVTLKLSYLMWGKIYKELEIPCIKIEKLPCIENFEDLKNDDDYLNDDWMDMTYIYEEFHLPDLDTYEMAGIQVDVSSFGYEELEDTSSEEDATNDKFKFSRERFADEIPGMSQVFPDETKNFINCTVDNQFTYPFVAFLKSRRVGKYLEQKQINKSLAEKHELNAALTFLISAVFDPMYIQYPHAYFHENKGGVMYSFFAYGYTDMTGESLYYIHGKVYQEIAVRLLDLLLSQAETYYTNS